MGLFSSLKQSLNDSNDRKDYSNEKGSNYVIHTENGDSLSDYVGGIITVCLFRDDMVYDITRFIDMDEKAERAEVGALRLACMAFISIYSLKAAKEVPDLRPSARVELDELIRNMAIGLIPQPFPTDEYIAEFERADNYVNPLNGGSRYDTILALNDNSQYNTILANLFLTIYDKLVKDPKNKTAVYRDGVLKFVMDSCGLKEIHGLATNLDFMQEIVNEIVIFDALLKEAIGRRNRW